MNDKVLISSSLILFLLFCVTIIFSSGCGPRADTKEKASASVAVQLDTDTENKSMSLENKRGAKNKDKKKKKSRLSRRSTKRQIVNSKSRAIPVEQLEALGYIEGTYDPRSDLSGVIRHAKDLVHKGYNLYTSRKTSDARLIDMEGKQVFEWVGDDEGAWQHVELVSDGGLVGIVKNKLLFRIDQNSKKLWSVQGTFHHDLDIYKDKIVAISRKAKKIDDIHSTTKILADSIDFYSLEGDKIRSISIIDSLKRSVYSFLIPSIHNLDVKKDGFIFDILHTNHVEVFDGTLVDTNPLYREGNLLISMRSINSIAILDGESGDLLWLWGPSNLTYQHHPTLLKNGNILIFDNGLEKSRVIELSPQDNRIVWQYMSDDFFTEKRGSNQRLPNGNTLITESDTGYVFEVTKTGEIVWEFANPDINNKQERQAIWRMLRIEPNSLGFNITTSSKH